MDCSNCGAENAVNHRFCEACGKPLVPPCSACGHQVRASARFCEECGHALPEMGTDAATGPSEASTPTQVDAYTPEHLAKRILASRDMIEGERKLVTVLFADVVDSTHLIDGADPEIAGRILEPALDAMMTAVHRYEGTVTRVTGDGIMALFGAPLAHEDHALRACHAALDIQQAIGAVTDDVRRRHGTLVQSRVGLNSGQVIVKAIGNDLRMDYDAIGSTVHLAARMEQSAAPDTVQLSAETLSMAEGFVKVESLGQVPFKGVPEPIDVFRLTGITDIQSRLQWAQTMGLSHFVGRREEITALNQVLEFAGSGEGGVVAVMGEPGVGKSRLFHEFIHSHRAKDWLTLETACKARGKSIPYLPVTHLLKNYFGIEDRDDNQRIRDKVAGKLAALDEALDWAQNAILSLLDVPVQEAEWQQLDPAQRRRQTFNGVLRLLLTECQKRPVVLVFEDLHWIDGETQAFFDTLVESISNEPILLLINYRPEYQDVWAGKPYHTRLRLDPLTPATAEELLSVLLGDDGDTSSLKQLLIERTGGNPLFIEESVRTLEETGALSGERGAYRLTTSIDEIDVPASVQTIIAARIDRLPADEKRLLQSAAVIGRDVPLALLNEIADANEEEVRRELDNLRRAEFMFEVRASPDAEYSFKHFLIQDVAYGSVLQERRRELHARIVDAIERLAGDRLDEHIERLAHHAFEGELWFKAVDYARQAGRRSLDRSAYQESADAYNLALTAQAQLPLSREEMERGIELRFEIRRALMPLGQQEEVTKRIHEAEVIARGINDNIRLGRAYSMTIINHWMAGNYDLSLKVGENARPIMQSSGDLGLEVMAKCSLAFTHHAVGAYAEAVASSDEVIARLHGDDVYNNFNYATLPAVVARCTATWGRAELGRFDEGSRLGEEAIEIAEVSKQYFSMAFAYFASGLVKTRQGDFADAIPLLEHCFNLCDSGFARTMLMWVAPFLGYAYLHAGRTDEAITHLEMALDPKVQKVGWPYVLWRFLLGEAYLRVGRRAEALITAEESLAKSREYGERGHEAWSLRLLGDIHASGDAPNGEAVKRFRSALELATALDMRPLAAHCHFGLARLHQKAGNQDAAATDAGAAGDLYRDMGMTYWLERAEAVASGAAPTTSTPT